MENILSFSFFPIMFFCNYEPESLYSGFGSVNNCDSWRDHLAYYGSAWTKNVYTENKTCI